MQGDAKFTIELDRQQFGFELSEQVGWALNLELQYSMPMFSRKLLLTVEGLDGSVRKAM